MPLIGRVRDAPTARWCMVGAFKANPLRDICRALGLPDLSLDPRYADLRRAGREQGGAAPTVPRALLDQHDARTGSRKLEEQDLLCAPVRDHARGAGRSEQTLRTTAMILEGSGGAGPSR